MPGGGWLGGGARLLLEADGDQLRVVTEPDPTDQETVPPLIEAITPDEIKIETDELDTQIVSWDDIDTVMKLGMNHPMGPLALADLIGLDTCLAIMETIYNGFNDSKYRPCPLLRKYVEAGRLGRKTGHGFYNYN